MTEKDVVKKFIDSPFQLCGDGFDNTGGAKIKNHYRNWVALLHLLLVKHGKKKGFVFRGMQFGKPRRLCGKLELSLKQADVQFTEIVPTTKKMDEGNAVSLMRLLPEVESWFGPKPPTYFASMDEASLAEIVCEKMDAKKFGEIEGYPDCCVDAFIGREWDDFELADSHFGNMIKENRMHMELERLLETSFAKIKYPAYEEFVRRQSARVGIPAENLHLWYFILLNARHPDPQVFTCCKVVENNAKRVVAYARAFQEYPFVLHLACEKCLSDTNSPSATMNDNFSKFCKNEYPELYERIVGDANAIDPQKQKSDLEELGLERGCLFQL